jgi:hypothetical protein
MTEYTWPRSSVACTSSPTVDPVVVVAGVTEISSFSPGAASRCSIVVVVGLVGDVVTAAAAVDVVASVVVDRVVAVVDVVVSDDTVTWCRVLSDRDAKANTLTTTSAATAAATMRRWRDRRRTAFSRVTPSISSIDRKRLLLEVGSDAAP